MKNLILFICIFVCSCTTVQKAKELCPSQTLNAFVLLQVKQLRVSNPDTALMENFIKCHKTYMPRIGDVVKVDGITGVIISKPVPAYGRTGQTTYGRTSDPTKNGGSWVHWWDFRFVAQSSNCSTSVFRTAANAQLTHFTRLSKF